jgi:hypothetical protein
MNNVNLNPRACTLCGKDYIPTSNRQKYCVECQADLNRKRCTERYCRTYRPKGYNQTREQNNCWRGGTGTYRHIAREIHGDACTECGSTKFTCAHHKDEDRTNNNPGNLEVLCRSCHAKRHELHKNFSLKV